MVNRIIDKIGRQLLGNSFWLLLEKLIKLIIGLYVGVTVARFLGPEGMGIWNYGLAIFAFFTVVSTFGLDYITHREFLQNKDRQSDIFTTVLIIRFLGAVLGVGLPSMYIIATTGFTTQNATIVLILTTGYFFQIFDIIEYYYQAYLKANRTVIARLIAFLAISAYKLYLVNAGASLYWFVASSTFEFFLGAIFLIISWATFKDKIQFGRFDFTLAKSLLADALPFSFASILSILHFRIDQVMITQMLGETENGIYSVAIRIFELIIFLLAVIIPSYIPVLAKTFKENQGQFVGALKQFYTIVTWLAIATLLGTFFLAEPVMRLLYGSQFEGSGKVLTIFALCIYPIFLGQAVTNYLIITNRKRFNLIKTGVGLALNVVLNFWFIKSYGIQGAAISSLLSNAVSLLIIVFLSDNHGHGKLFLQAFKLKLPLQQSKTIT